MMNIDGPITTVALPLFRSGHIVWYALESLSRQITNYPWELIIAEEDVKPVMEESVIKQYMLRLQAAGCVRYHYISLQKWIPLSQKWLMLAQSASPASRAFIFQAADCYSRPHRLQDMADLILEGYDWADSEMFAIYSLIYDKIIIKHNTGGPCGDMSMRTDYVQRVPLTYKKSCVDRWLFQECGRLAGREVALGIRNTDARPSVYLHGFNNISNLGAFFTGDLEHPWASSDKAISDLLPASIIKRLLTLRPKATILATKPWRLKR